MEQQKKQEENQPLYSLRTYDGLYSRIFTREDLDKFIKEHNLSGTICLVTTVPFCEVNVTVNIPWEKGFETLRHMHELSRSSEAVAPVANGSMRSESAGKVGSPPGRKKKGSGVILPSNGEIGD